LAVLEKRLGANFKEYDVNLNITGGINVEEPGLDLAIIAAVISSYKDIALDNDLAVIGEVGLGGEVRAVGQIEKRINELKKLSFKKAIIPAANAKNIAFDPEIKIDAVKDIAEFVRIILK